MFNFQTENLPIMPGIIRPMSGTRIRFFKPTKNGAKKLMNFNKCSCLLISAFFSRFSEIRILCSCKRACRRSYPALSILSSAIRTTLLTSQSESSRNRFLCCCTEFWYAVIVMPRLSTCDMKNRRSSLMSESPGCSKGRLS